MTPVFLKRASFDPYGFPRISQLLIVEYENDALKAALDTVRASWNIKGTNSNSEGRCL
jgi:hypothetical protein